MSEAKCNCGPSMGTIWWIIVIITFICVDWFIPREQRRDLRSEKEIREMVRNEILKQKKP